MVFYIARYLVSKLQMDFNATRPQCKVVHAWDRTPICIFNKLTKWTTTACITTNEEKDIIGVMITNNLKSYVNCQAAYKKANRVLAYRHDTRTINKSTEIPSL